MPREQDTSFQPKNSEAYGWRNALNVVATKKTPSSETRKGSSWASSTKGLKKSIAEAGNHSVEQLAEEENEVLLGLIWLRAQQGKALQSATYA